MADVLVKAAKENYSRFRPKKGLTLVELKRKMSNKTEFLWRNMIPAKMLTLLTAREGVGKSTTSLAIVKEVLETHSEGYVIWIASEGLTTTVSQATWLGLDNIDRFVIATNREGSFTFNFSQHSDLKRLQEILKDYEPVVLVVIDCLSAVSPFDDADQKTGKILYRLGGICEKAGAGCLVLHHENKGERTIKLDKVSGSTQITRAPRVVLRLDYIRGVSLKRKIEVIKSNLLEKIEPIEVVKTPTGIVFLEHSTVDHEETQRQKAEELLVSLFTYNKELPATTIYGEAEQAGITIDLLKKVKQSLGIRSQKIGTKWIWSWDISSYKEDVSLVPLEKRNSETLDNQGFQKADEGRIEGGMKGEREQGRQGRQERQERQGRIYQKDIPSSQNSSLSTLSEKESQDSYSLLNGNSSPSLETKEEFVL